MKPVPSVHRSATALLAANLGLGLIPFVGLAFCHPMMRWQGVIVPGLCAVAALTAGWFLMPDLEPHLDSGQTATQRVSGGLLLGASLTAIDWKQQSLPLATAVIGLGFCIRWWLFAMETLEIRRADRRRQPLPSTSTRIRRACTLNTAVVIPVLILAGVSCLPLLWISFVLTLFCQWTVWGETRVARFNKPVTSSIDADPMSGNHAPDGGIY